jgi:hypothetical protein
LLADVEMKNSLPKLQKKMKRLVVLCIIGASLTLILSCLEKSQDQEREAIVREIRILLNKQNFEAARLVAIDTLDPEIKSLYYEADKYLGYASHLDVRCNERIEEILYDLVKKVPVSYTKLNRDIYAELVALYPENQLYRKKFIYYDRKRRGMIQ